MLMSHILWDLVAVRWQMHFDLHLDDVDDVFLLLNGNKVHVLHSTWSYYYYFSYLIKVTEFSNP